MLDILARLFRRAEEKKEVSWQWENTGFGLRFYLPGAEPGARRGSMRPPAFEDSLAAMQYVLLQQLVEAGEAVAGPDGTEIPAETACRLDETARDLLQLPGPWPGRMELKARGRTTDATFELELLLCEARGIGTVSYTLSGSILHAAGEDFLPDAAQWQALCAVCEHAATASGMRTEAHNLRAVYALQCAVRQGLSLDMRRFQELQVHIPDSVGVTVVENADGSLRLVPDLGEGLNPESLEPRLGQLAEKSVLRSGAAIVLLDEKRLAAVQEILSSRHISRKDKADFFARPTAWLDAELVDLDIGFSARMHGMEVYKKAYFGLTEPSQTEWFADEGKVPQLLLLSACAPLITSEAELASLTNAVEQALTARADSLTFGQTTLLLPADPEQTRSVLAQVQHTVRERLAREDAAGSTSTGADDASGDGRVKPVQISVSIDLHDETLEGVYAKTVREDMSDTAQDSLPLYDGDLACENLAYTFKSYQETGTRWLLGHMKPLLQAPCTAPETSETPVAASVSGKTDARAAECTRTVSAGALLADDMGLGKTFMVLAALNVLARTCEHQGRICKPVLAVMPVVLLDNWRQEIDKVFVHKPFKDIVVLQAGADLGRFRRTNKGREHLAMSAEDIPSLPDRNFSLKVGEDFREKRLDMPGRLVLTNYDTLRDYQFSLSLVDWGCVIFDEAQEIRNPNTLKSRAARALRTDFCLAMTGTPVENSLTDFWAIFDTVRPGLLGSFQGFNKTWVLPVARARKSGDTEEAAALRLRLGRELRTKVGAAMLRRTKEEQLDGLPRKIVHDGQEEAQYSAVMSGAQLERYNSIVNAVVQAKQADTEKTGAESLRTILLPSLRRLQNVSLHPDLADGEVSLTSLKEGRAWLCRSAKLSLMLTILDEIRQREEKVILFVINRALQRLLALILGELYGIHVHIVNGETKTVSGRQGTSGRRSRSDRSESFADAQGSAQAMSRMELIRDFEAGEGFQIICMSPLAAGVGLTVTGANNVIHLERHWNPAREAQATDRVYRIGATKDVHIYLPLLRHPSLMSFDENLALLLSRKTEIRNAVMSVEEVQAQDFDSQKMFGAAPQPDAMVTADWLETMSWESFEALVACLARRSFGGTVWLTKRSGDHGADVVVTGTRECAIIECKLSRRPYGDSGAACKPYTACTEYGKRLGRRFTRAILAVNAPQVEHNVRERAAALGVTIWDRDYLAAELGRAAIPCTEVEAMLASERLA